MSEFGNTIKAFAPPKATVREIATRVDLDPTNLSRILTSQEGRTVQLDTLKNICMGLTTSRPKQAELNAAYLRDLRIPALAGLIEVRVNSSEKHARKDHDASNPAHILAELVEKLDPASVRALCQIAKNLNNRPLRRAILSLGEVADSAK